MNITTNVKSEGFPKSVETKDLAPKDPTQVKAGNGAFVVGGIIPGGAILSAAISR